MHLPHDARRRRQRACIALAVAAALLSCSESSTGPRFTGPISLDIVSGNNQSAGAGSELPNPLVVRVTDANGAPVQGQIVNFVVVEGGGHVFAGAASTNENGRAQDWWTLGDDPNAPQKLEVRAVDPETGEKRVFATFTATVLKDAVVRVEVSPALDSIPFNGTTQLTATAYDAFGGNPGGTPAWSSSDATIASVDENGLVTGHKGGTATITATIGAKSGTATIVVSSIAYIEVTPYYTFMAVGDSAQLTARALDANFQVVPGRRITWTSSDPSLVSVSQTGLVIGLAASVGKVTITASSEGAEGTALVFVSLPPQVRVTVGFGSTCAGASDGQTYCWGDGSNGNFGNGATQNHLTPVLGAPGHRFDALGSGQWHVCGLTAAGGAYCWGAGTTGELGNGVTQSSATPVPVSGGLSFSMLSVNYSHACAVTTGGAAYCWGAGTFGQLGNNDSRNSSVPVPVAGGHQFSTVAAGALFSCGLDTAGEAWCWGYQGSGQVGNGRVHNGFDGVPNKVVGGHTFVSITAGASHACALQADGRAYCWGDGVDGQLGNGQFHFSTGTPTPVGGGLTFARLVAGTAQTCGITTGGATYCWGNNSYGQLGDGTTTRRSTPTAVDGAHSFVAIASGERHSCGVNTQGATYCWGSNQYGQFGDGTTTSRLKPHLPAGY